MENIQLSNELDRFFNALRKLPQALERDVEVIEESVKDKLDAKRVIGEHPFTSIGVAGALGFLMSGAIKLTGPGSKKLVSSVAVNPMFNTVATMAITTLLKIAADKIENMTRNEPPYTNGVDYSSSLKH